MTKTRQQSGPSRPAAILGGLLQRSLTLLGAAGFTLLFFLVLPLMESIGTMPAADLMISSVDVALPPPPPPIEPEPEEEEEEEPQEPPKLDEPEIEPLDLSQLELALNPGTGGGGGWSQGDFGVKIETVVSAEQNDAIFSLADLDQKPRATYQPGPTMTAQMRRSAPGTVYILFIVNEQGRVENPIVQQSTSDVFERPAVAAVKQWRFEPGMREGQPVRFRMRVPITFPRG